MSELTLILERLREGDHDAAGDLFSLVHQELRSIANRQAREDDYTDALTPTELVNEVYIRLFENAPPSFVDRNYFFAAVAQSMRRIRVDHYRATKAQKRGGQHQQVDLTPELAGQSEDGIDLLALDEALHRLEVKDADRAKLVELRFFAGLTMSRVAEVLGVSLATAERQWRYTKAWLLAELQ